MKVLLGMCSALLVAGAQAQCYDKLAMPDHRPATAREITILVDETTVIPEEIGRVLMAHLAKALHPGDRVNLLAFSTFTRTRFLREVMVRELEQPPPPEALRNMPARKTRDLQTCIAVLRPAIVKELQDGLGKLLKDASAEIAHSEIVMSLREVGLRLQASPIRTKLLLLVSDGMEHSGITSFYRNRGLRVVNPDEEMKRIQGKRMLADLAGARVFIFGGGLSATDTGARDPAALVALENVWSDYVTASNGVLAAFGKPTILVPLQ